MKVALRAISGLHGRVTLSSNLFGHYHQTDYSPNCSDFIHVPPRNRIFQTIIWVKLMFSMLQTAGRNNITQRLLFTAAVVILH